jgi:hypothetical protein
MGFVVGSRVKFIKTDWTGKVVKIRSDQFNEPLIDVLMDDQTSDETEVKFVARAFELEEIDA